VGTEIGDCSQAYINPTVVQVFLRVINRPGTDPNSIEEEIANSLKVLPKDQVHKVGERILSCSDFVTRIFESLDVAALSVLQLYLVFKFSLALLGNLLGVARG
jgi:hypothetical protein